MLFHNFGFIKCILAVCQLITILLEKCKYNLGLGGHMTYALGSSGTMSMAMSSFVCLFVCHSVCLSVCLCVCLTFFSAMLQHRNFYFGQLSRYGQPPEPIEFHPDQTMVIRLISLMSKLLKLSIS